MNLFHLLPILVISFYLTVIFGVLYFIYKWVNTFISLKEEQNELLREIIKKLESK